MNQLPVSAEPRDLLQLRRSDLAATLAVYRRESTGGSGLLLLAFGLAGLCAAVAVSVFAERHHWPETWGPVVIIGGWVPMLTSLVVLVRRERKLRARLQLFCPSCGAGLLDRSVSTGVSRADLAVASGCCQHCGDEVLARDA